MFLFNPILSIMISSWMILSIHALPISYNNKMQTVFYQDKTRLYEQEDAWFISQEYDVFSSITDYYENMVDATLSSESELLLLNLIHLPKESMNKALNLQGQLFGIESLSDKQLIKMPSIIGKHVQAMNTKVYESIENIITLYWHTIWTPKVLTHNNQEEHIISFLSSFNSIVAKRLIEEIDEYDLLQEIKSDLLNLPAFEREQRKMLVNNNEITSLFKWLKNSMIDFFFTNVASATTTRPLNPLDLETDFLRQYLSEIRTSLLMELHIQFMDFFTRIQFDIVEQLSAYYDE